MIDLHPDTLQDLIGKPYVHGARGPDAFDCWGLCAEVYRRAGITLPDYRVEHLTHDQTRALVRGLAVDHGEWIAKPEDWCFVFDRRDGHIGLFWHGYVMHSARGMGVVMQRIDQFETMHPSIAFARWRD
jgi:NlpC/P60 family